MSLVQLWSQIVDKQAEKILHMSQTESFAKARQIDDFYHHRDEDSDDDLDMHEQDDPMRREQLFDRSSQQANVTEAPTHLAGLRRSAEVSAEKVERQATDRAVDEVDELIQSFCRRTALTRVMPTCKEVEDLWEATTVIMETLPDMGKACICDAMVRALAQQLSGDLNDHGWKPQLRVLCVLELYFCKGSLQRHIAEAVLDGSSELLQHLATEVNPCREKAIKVMELSKLAEVLPSEEGIVVGSDGGIFADVQKVARDEDEDTNAGTCSIGCDSQESQDEQFVTEWPSPLMDINSPMLELSGMEWLHPASESPAPEAGPEGPSTQESSSMSASPEVFDYELNVANEAPVATHSSIPCFNSQLADPFALLLPVAEERSMVDLAPGYDPSIAAEAWPDKIASSPSRSVVSRRNVPVIPWGIEDTLPEQSDPFASLLSL